MDQWLNQSENGVKSESDPTFFLFGLSPLVNLKHSKEM